MSDLNRRTFLGWLGGSVVAFLTVLGPKTGEALRARAERGRRCPPDVSLGTNEPPSWTRVTHQTHALGFKVSPKMLDDSEFPLPNIHITEAGRLVNPPHGRPITYQEFIDLWYRLD